MDKLIESITSLTACLACLTGVAIGFLLFYFVVKCVKWCNDIEAQKKKLKKSEEDDIAFLARNEAFKACHEYLKDKKENESKN